MRRRILTGFVLLGMLLFLSGMVSIFELMRLGSMNQQILDRGTQNIEFTKKMLDIVQEQNTAFLEMVTAEDPSFAAKKIDNGILRLSSLMESASANSEMIEFTAKISSHVEQYNKVLKQVADSVHNENIKKFIDVYGVTYYNLTRDIKDYMLLSLEKMHTSATQLERNAYRSIMPGIMALAVAIIIIIVFYLMIDLYFMQPLGRINFSLKNYLDRKIPFNPKADNSRDEVLEIRNNIEKLTLMIKGKSNNDEL